MNIPSRTIVKVLSITVAFIVLLYAVRIVGRELVWIGTAFFLAVALNPLVETLSRYMPWRSRGLAISVVALLVISILGFLLVSFIPPLISQSESLANSLPNYTDQLINGHNVISDQIRHYNLVDRIRSSQGEITKYISTAGGSFYTFIQGIFSGLIAVTTIIVLSVFMLLEGPNWIAAIWRLVPPKRRDHGCDLVQHMYKAVSGYVTGNLVTSLIAAVATAVILVILNVPYAIPLGLFVAIADLVPLVGATIGAVVVTGVALFSSTLSGIIVAAFFLIYQQVENHVLQPIIYGKTVEVSPLTVLIAIILGAALGGLVGALVAIPAAASLQILIKDYVSHHFKYE
jgi:predicted PurR-regulated permease PerM